MIRAEQLPDKAAFHNTLTDQDISEEDYLHAQKVFKTFKCKNMLEYMKLYMKLDVALLADLFLNFRELMFSKFDLDPCHFISLPSYAFSCMLKLTEISIEPIEDIDIFQFLSQNIRGGFSFVSQRMECTATNPKKKLLYLDANNL